MSACKHGWASENYVKCPRCYDEARWRDEDASLRGQIRDLRRTVAFFASVIKSGEGWSEQCDRLWPVTLDPCIHDFHRAEHGVMPCTKCGEEAPPVAARDAGCGRCGGLGTLICTTTYCTCTGTYACPACGGSGKAKAGESNHE